MGYPVDLFIRQDIEEEFICVICQDVLQDPRVTQPCEHAFCKNCIYTWTNTSNTCPIDRVDVRKYRKPQRLYTNLLHRLELRCRFSGCTRIIQLGDLKEHDEKCDFNPNKKTGTKRRSEEPSTSADAAKRARIHIQQLTFHSDSDSSDSNYDAVGNADNQSRVAQQDDDDTRSTISDAPSSISTIFSLPSINWRMDFNNDDAASVASSQHLSPPASPSYSDISQISYPFESWSQSRHDESPPASPEPEEEDEFDLANLSPIGRDNSRSPSPTYSAHTNDGIDDFNDSPYYVPSSPSSTHDNDDDSDDDEPAVGRRYYEVEEQDDGENGDGNGSGAEVHDVDDHDDVFASFSEHEDSEPEVVAGPSDHSNNSNNSDDSDTGDEYKPAEDGSDNSDSDDDENVEAVTAESASDSDHSSHNSTSVVRNGRRARRIVQNILTLTQRRSIQSRRRRGTRQENHGRNSTQSAHLSRPRTRTRYGRISSSDDSSVDSNFGFGIRNSTRHHTSTDSNVDSDSSSNTYYS